MGKQELKSPAEPQGDSSCSGHHYAKERDLSTHTSMTSERLCASSCAKRCATTLHMRSPEPFTNAACQHLGGRSGFLPSAISPVITCTTAHGYYSGAHHHEPRKLHCQPEASMMRDLALTSCITTPKLKMSQ